VLGRCFRPNHQIAAAAVAAQASRPARGLAKLTTTAPSIGPTTNSNSCAVASSA
jgi:hypothetical protein